MCGWWGRYCWDLLTRAWLIILPSAVFTYRRSTRAVFPVAHVAVKSGCGILQGIVGHPDTMVRG